MNIIDTIKNSPYLRSLLLICVILIVGLIFVLTESHKVRTNALRLYESTLDNQRHLIELQQILIKEQENPTVLTHRFADFPEVIPFITTLEELFYKVDPNLEITLQGDELQIEKELQAKYVLLLPKIEDEEIFKKTLKELYESNNILEIQNLVVDYDKDKIVSSQFMVKLHLL